MPRLFLLAAIATAITLALVFSNLSSKRINSRWLNYEPYNIKGVSSLWEERGPMLEAVYGLSDSSDWTYTWNKWKEPPTDHPVNWSDIVFIMNIYNSVETDELLVAHFDTWLNHLGEGADVVFVTDKDDDRSFEEILPRTKNIKATCHVYKSSALKEDERLRYKVVDGFLHVGGKEFGSKKKYFFKMDTDTYVVPEYLLAYLNDLHEKTYPKPVHVGWGNHCDWFCYTDGAFYGFNDIGLSAVNDYFIKHPFMLKLRLYPAFDIDSEERLKKFQRLMTHEDFMISYVFREATQRKIPMVHNPLFRTHNKGISDKRGMSYHRVKDPLDFYHYESRFYFWNGTLKVGL